MRNDRLGFVVRCMKEYGDVVRLTFPKAQAHVVSSPDGVRHVLQDNHRNYDKATPGLKKMKLLLGEGLVTSDGAFWLRQRRIAQPAFHRQRIASFGTLMSRDAAELAARWELLARDRAPIDVSIEMMRLTLRIVSEALLSRDLSDTADRVGSALTIAMHEVNDRITRVFELPMKVPTPANRRFVQSRAVLDEIVIGLIEDRRKSGEDAGDLLSMLMNARDEETGETMNDVQLRDEVMTIFLAGHETTANALTWAFYLLSQNPRHSARLTEETRSVLNGRPATLEDLPKLEYVRMVIDETMRLYPPAWFLVRRAIEDDEIGGFHIPAKTLVMIPPWTVHRNPRVWENPEAFDPERFRKDRLAAMPRFAYFPFGGGPRLCIGNNFALMEAQLILATLAQRFRPKLHPEAKVELDPQVTLRPKYGMRMWIERA